FLAVVRDLEELYAVALSWPRGEEPRAVAVSICAEMLSGFAALRTLLPMDLKLRRRLDPIAEEAQADIRRVCGLWQACRQRFGADGPFLFGHASLADAFYAPVAARFHSYQVDLPGDAADYVATLYQWPAFQRWYRAALRETETV